MKKFRLIAVSLVLLLFTAGCSDIFEPSLENKTMEVIAPSDSAQSSTYRVVFWWNPMENALKYKLQIVRPDFNSVSQLVLDTMVTTTKFTYTLSPGNYQWRVRAENGSSQSPYAVRTLEILTSSLNGQPMTALNPVNGTYFNSKVDFTWQEMPGASLYQLEVDTFPGNFTNSTGYKLNVPISNEFYTFTFKNSGTFKWRVKAMNSSNETSQYSDVRTIYIDNDKPDAVKVLTSSVSGSTILLSWNPSASADVMKYRIYVQKVVAGTDTASYPAVVNYYPKEVSSTSEVFSGGLSGERFVWRVVAIDNANNGSLYSPYRSFIR